MKRQVKQKNQNLENKIMLAMLVLAYPMFLIWCELVVKFGSN